MQPMQGKEGGTAFLGREDYPKAEDSAQKPATGILPLCATFPPPVQSPPLLTGHVRNAVTPQSTGTPDQQVRPGSLRQGAQLFLGPKNPPTQH